MKGQIDATRGRTKENRDAKDLVVGRGVAEEERKKEVARLLRQYRDLLKKSDYAAAERVAMQAKQLDPDDPAVVRARRDRQDAAPREGSGAGQRRQTRSSSSAA